MSHKTCYPSASCFPILPEFFPQEEDLSESKAFSSLAIFLPVVFNPPLTMGMYQEKLDLVSIGTSSLYFLTLIFPRSGVLCANVPLLEILAKVKSQSQESGLMSRTSAYYL
jgi:hypothetical protein